jgi:hypothetical protein
VTDSTPHLTKRPHVPNSRYMQIETKAAANTTAANEAEATANTAVAEKDDYINLQNPWDKEEIAGRIK